MTKHEEGRTTPSTSSVPMCKPMAKTGITDPDSPEGIEYCTERCPYPDGCVVANERVGKSKKDLEIAKAKRLRTKGRTFDEIAAILKRSSMTVRRYLKS